MKEMKDKSNVAPKCHPSSPHSKGKVLLVNKRNPCIRMNVSREDIIKMSQGKDLQFYDPHSMFVLKVRTFTPKTNIMKDAPYKTVLREVAASKSSSTSLNDESRDINLRDSKNLGKKEHSTAEDFSPPHQKDSSLMDEDSISRESEEEFNSTQPTSSMSECPITFKIGKANGKS